MTRLSTWTACHSKTAFLVRSKTLQNAIIPCVKTKRVFLKGDELGADSFQKAFVCLSRRCENVYKMSTFYVK